MRGWIGCAVALMVLLLTCPLARAGSPTDELRTLFAGATRILDPRTPEGLEERVSAVRIMVREVVDFREAARLSLGPTWSARTQAERDEFVPLFADFLERALIAGIAGKIRPADGVKVSYLGEVVDGAMATVWTTIASKSGFDLPLNYRMIQRGGRWAIRDVVIDGVSLAANYRAQLLRVMQTSSYPDLIMQMRARVGGSPAAALMTSAVADDVAVGPVEPAPAFEMARSAPAEAIAGDEVIERPPVPRAQDLAEGGRSEPPSRLDLDLTLLARAVPEPDAVVPQSPAPSASPREDTVAAPTPRQTRGGSKPVQAPVARGTGSTSLSATKAYWVQVGAFKSLEAARRLASLLLEEEAPSRPSSIVVEPASADAPLVRVRVGPFPDRWAAASKVREIEARGHKPFVAAPERD